MSRRPAAWRGLAALGALALLPLAVLAPVTPATAAPTSEPASAAAGGGSYAKTKTLQRSLVFDGETVVVDERKVTVRANRTQDLRGRERIRVSWSGARPTGGRAASPFGELGLMQEYPVVILQCRGVEGASAPAKRISPETCWTSSRMQRSQSVDDSAAVWRHDVHASQADREQKSGLSPIPAACQDPATFSTHITPFRAATGKVYSACTAETMPPEAAVGAAFPPAEMAAFTDLSGRGSVKFEVRTKVENESLGCSEKVACSVVVIPIMGISCADSDAECSKAGRFRPGASNFAGEGVDGSVSPLYWWSESNWRNRFSIPLSFGLPPDACNVLDDRAPTGFYGSELMAQASIQWSPAYCLDKKRFKFQHNRMADAAGFNLAENGGGAAAFVSSRHEPKGTDPMGYAPTAVTGFSIGYIIDRPDNAGEYLDLRLTPRLLAKLLTQSYAGSDRGRGHPGMGDNPLSINQDPEFQRLNPGLDTIAREAGATLLSLSGNSDVIKTLTTYIASDKDASAFVAGKKDPWGMVVNPSYKGFELPTAEWPLLDDYVPPSEQECHQQNPTPYFTQVAAPVTSLQKIAEAVLDSWPNVQTKCERATSSDPWKIGRVDRQGVGSRFMLGLVSSGDASRLGLNEARLETRGGVYVGPSQASMTKALRVAKPSSNGMEPFTLDMDAVVRSHGYPGTMVVYTAARTANLPQADASKVAMFIDVATSEGQRPGYANGELPGGYLPLRRTGATAPLVQQAGRVAAAVRAQEVPGSDDGGSGGGGTGGGGGSPGDVPVDDAVDPAAPGGPGKISTVTDRVEMPDTVLVAAGPTGRLVPTLGLIVLVGAAMAAGLRITQLVRRTR